VGGAPDAGVEEVAAAAAGAPVTGVRRRLRQVFHRHPVPPLVSSLSAALYWIYLLLGRVRPWFCRQRHTGN
jgi:hypothetical protein